MSEAKRYNLCKYQNGYAEMEQDNDGDWVDYTDYVKLKQQNKELRKTLKQCMTWLKKESKSMPNYDITQSVLWQNFEKILKQEERDE